MNPAKSYIYKISNGGGFLGVLQNVNSPFGYNQLIGTALSQMTIMVAQDPASPNGIDPLIVEDNLVDVYEVSAAHVNGIRVFSGYISKWRATYGGSQDVQVTVISNGQDLGNYLVPGDFSNIVEQSQATQNDNIPLFESGGYLRALQSFTTGSGVTNVSAIAIWGSVAAAAKDYTLRLYASMADFYNGTPALSTKTISVSDTGGGAEQIFVLDAPVTVTPNTQYFFVITVAAATGEAFIYQWDGQTYLGGEGWYSDIILGSTWGPLFTIGAVNQHASYYFKTYRRVYNTAKSYTADDPSTILTEIMDYYNDNGGAIVQPGGGYAPTGVSVDYTFNLNTILEGIQKIADLGPADWYWYVDVTDNTLYYKQASAVAEHTIINKRHISTLSIESTKEEIINVAYFTGGDDGTASNQNVYVALEDLASLAANRRGLDRIADPKVKGTGGAAIGTVLAQNDIDQHNARSYITQVVITDAVYDITTYKPGQMVDFADFDNFIDDLLLQIVGLTRAKHSVTLMLGILPVRSSKKVEDIQRSLLASQTTNNPNAPS